MAIEKNAGTVKKQEFVWESLRREIWIQIFQRPWPLGIGAIALTITNLFMFMYARALGVFPPMAMWGSAIYNLIGFKTESPFVSNPVKAIYLDMHSLLDIGIILGALGASLIACEFKIRKEDLQGYLMGVAGGILMGFGAVLMPPCNVGGFWVATMAFSLSGPLAAIGLLFGAYLGGKVLQYQMGKSIQNIDFGNAPDGYAVKPRLTTFQPVQGITIFGFIFALAFLYYYFKLPQNAGLLLFGALFGVIIQRSRLCFVAAFREILISRNGKVMKWVLLSMAVGVLGFAILKGQGYQPLHKVFPAGWHNIVGGLIFGIGMTLAGGCGLGILVRSGEGYTRCWIAILSAMLVSGAWVHIYGQKVGQGWLYGKPVYLPDVFGWGGTLAFTYAFLLLFYLFILWVEAGKHETT